MGLKEYVGIFRRGPSGGLRPPPTSAAQGGAPAPPRTPPCFYKNKKKSKPFNHEGFSLSNLAKKNLVVEQF